MNTANKTANTSSVNDKIHALLEKKGKPACASSENDFCSALEQLVSDWQAESLASCINPLDARRIRHERSHSGNVQYTNFFDTKVVNEVHTKAWTYRGVGLTFDGASYDYLSCDHSINVDSYREALQALCDLHGWRLNDRTLWAITFHPMRVSY